VRAALAKHAIEVAAARQPGPSRRRASCAVPGPSAGRPLHQTVSRPRPFARRRLSVRRPARVCILALNPWALARLRFLGW
jgi:hypothetical protein